METLDLSGNIISAVEDSALDGLPGLKTLQLSSNSLSALPSDLFKESPDLREIHLQNNSLSGLAADLGCYSIDIYFFPESVPEAVPMKDPGSESSRYTRRILRNSWFAHSIF